MLQYFRIFDSQLIVAEDTRLLRDREVTGDPAGASSAEEALGPLRGKASARSGN